MLASSECEDPNLYNKIMESLSKTIIQLQSDQILQQMRNDKELYEYKMGHILQILEKEMNYMQEFEILTQDNQNLRRTIISLENEINNQKMMFTESIDNIETNAHKILQNKDTQIRNLNDKLHRQIQEKQVLQNQIQNYQHKISKLSHSNKQIHQQKVYIQEQYKITKKQLSQYQKSLHSQQITLTNQAHNYDKIIKQTKLQHSQQIQEYEHALRKMQGDMLIIKNQWHKKCQDVEKNLRNLYQQKLLQLQEKKTKEMLNHIDAIKQGKQTIVIKTDENLMNNKLGLIREQHQGQVGRLKKQIQEIQILLENAQSQLAKKTIQIDKVNKMISETKKDNEEKERQIRCMKQKEGRQSQKIALILKQHEKQEQKNNIEVLKLQKETKNLKNRLKQSQQTAYNLQISLKSLKDQAKQQIQKNQKLYDELKNKQIILQNNMKNNEQLNVNLNKQKNIADEQLKKIEQLNIQLNEKERILNTMKKNTDKKNILYKDIIERVVIQLTSAKKAISLLKQEIKYSLTHLKEGIMTKKLWQIIETIRDQTKNQCQGKSKQKITQLLLQIQESHEKEDVQFMEINKQKNNLKKQLQELQSCLLKKDKQIQQLSQNNQELVIQLTKFKQISKQELSLQKDKVFELQESLSRQQRQYHLNLEQAKAQVKDAIKKLSYKWTDEINKLQEQIKRRDNQFNALSEHTNNLLKQYEDVCDKQSIAKQQSKRYRKKYQQYKNKSEVQIEDLLQRLEKQSKQKIQLDKELRMIRNQVNHYQMPTSGFNRKNKNTESTPNIKAQIPTSSREQQLSELKQLVARTYEMTGGNQRQKPQKDLRRRNLY